MTSGKDEGSRVLAEELKPWTPSDDPMKVITCRITPDMHAWLVQETHRTKMTMSDLFRRILEEYRREHPDVVDHMINVALRNQREGI